MEVCEACAIANAKQKNKQVKRLQKSVTFNKNVYNHLSFAYDPQ